MIILVELRPPGLKAFLNPGTVYRTKLTISFAILMYWSEEYSSEETQSILSLPNSILSDILRWNELSAEPWQVKSR